MKSDLPSVLAAVCTPIDDNGRPDFAAFDQVIDFVLDRGIEGIVVSGATGEYPHFDMRDRASLAVRAVQRVAGRGKVVVCTGTSSIFSTLQLTREVANSGCDGLLLPMPHYFRYTQEDLAAFCEAVCASVSLPCLLYNLPVFTNPIEVPTAIRLFETIPNLVGMKDSSGQVENLVPLAAGRKKSEYSLFVGDDKLLLRALQAGWDGVVSGMACFVPELILALQQSYRDGDGKKASSLQAMLAELIQKVVAGLPTPWGVRLGMAMRGVRNGPMHLPLSQVRQQQVEAARAQFSDWASAHSLKLDGIWKTIA